MPCPRIVFLFLLLSLSTKITLNLTNLNRALNMIQWIKRRWRRRRKFFFLFYLKFYQGLLSRFMKKQKWNRNLTRIKKITLIPKLMQLSSCLVWFYSAPRWIFYGLLEISKKFHSQFLSKVIELNIESFFKVAVNLSFLYRDHDRSKS